MPGLHPRLHESESLNRNHRFSSVTPTVKTMKWLSNCEFSPLISSMEKKKKSKVWKYSGVPGKKPAEVFFYMRLSFQNIKPPSRHPQGGRKGPDSQKEGGWLSWFHKPLHEATLATLGSFHFFQQKLLCICTSICSLTRGGKSLPQYILNNPLPMLWIK